MDEGGDSETQIAPAAVEEVPGILDLDYYYGTPLDMPGAKPKG